VSRYTFQTIRDDGKKGKWKDKHASCHN